MFADITNIIYNFRLKDGKEINYILELDKETLLAKSIFDKNTVSIDSLDWAKLESFKCPHCPLDSKLNEYCPLATNLCELIQIFSEYNSFEDCTVTVKSDTRTYTKKTSLQSGVSALLGAIMVASGCPIMRKLKPLLHFHLPFASLEETQIRVFSFYLLSQYVKYKKGELPDWEMNNLFNYYEEIRVLNKNVAKKIADLETRDTSINSITILNNFAEYVTFSLSEDDFLIYEKIFDEFIK